MEGLVTSTSAPLPASGFWRGRRVLLTGHTGFKGAWLALWLNELGAEVHGFALAPPSEPNLFELANVSAGIAADIRADLRDAGAVSDCLAGARPEIVLHLAAQSLVRPSYLEPVATFATNVMGTAHVLHAVRRANGVRAVVVVTTDKCYENRVRAHPCRETDPLGGHDPYSASKACAELLTACWRASFAAGDAAPRIATARAGNVIGAGDWASDRLLPDCIRAFSRREPVRLRNPHAVRPWQHVLEPLAGYLLLAERLCGADGANCARSWNFGPDSESDATVGHIAAEAARIWGNDARIEIAPDPLQLHEADTLRLDSSAARIQLGWRPRWPLARALETTVRGYRAHAAGVDLAAQVRAQILEYCATAGSAKSA